MKNVLEVKEYVDLVGGELDGDLVIKDGDNILVTTPPGCWGPMITPSIRSGHEVSRPVRLEGAQTGDSIALFIKKINVKSNYASSGTSKRFEGRFHKDPTINAICPSCNKENPETIIMGAGEEGIVCKSCKKQIIPQSISNGYTVMFDSGKKLGVCVPQKAADYIAQRVLSGEEAPPEGSRQHLVTILAKSDIEDLMTRVKPMVGNIGCIPKMLLPSSRNCGDMHRSLVSNNEFAYISKEDLTDAHMDINSVCEGSIVICPVKVEGGGIYIGDVHSMQGNGELANHAIDVTAEVLVEAKLIKELELEGPIIIPSIEEVDYRFKPFTEGEYETANNLLRPFGFSLRERLYPVQFVGSGDNLNDAIDNAIHRIGKITGLSREEIMNRGTISGEVEIGRTTGLIYMTIMLPESILEDIQLLEFAKQQYNK